jgi:hypothetical protein
LLTEDGTAFKDPTLNEGYQKYKAKKAREKKVGKSPEEWARSQTSSHFRKPLETQLGADFFKQGKAKVKIRDKPRPRNYPPDRYLADEAAVRPHIAKVLRAAGIDPVDGRRNNGRRVQWSKRRGYRNPGPRDTGGRACGGSKNSPERRRYSRVANTSNERRTTGSSQTVYRWGDRLFPGK